MKKNNLSVTLIIFIGVIFFLNSCSKYSGVSRILIFSKTAGYRHESIETGVAALTNLGLELGYEVEHTEDASAFSVSNLKRFKAVVFLSTTGDVLDHSQELDFQRFIQAGGGYLGIHAAADTEYDWEWYGQLVGAYFKSHPAQQNARLDVIDKSHLATNSLPSVWERWDEWYNFNFVDQDLQVLITIDESSYEGGENGENHPIAWHHNFDGGNAFYTGLGHTDESYDDPLFLKHLEGALRSVVEGVDLDYSKVTAAKPGRE